MVDLPWVALSLLPFPSGDHFLDLVGGRLGRLGPLNVFEERTGGKGEEEFPLCLP